MSITRRHLLGSAVALAATAPRVTFAADDDPLGVRRDFPIVWEGTYLNSASVAPSPAPVVAAGRRFIDSGGVSPKGLDEMLATTNRVRRQFASMIGSSPAEVAFVSSTSEGENLVANALDLGRGDNVVVDELHFLTSFVLYKHLERSRGIELRIVKHRDGAVAPADFEPAVDRRTRLVSVAWLSNQNGFRHRLRPLADLAHASGACLYADAIQAIGMFPVDVASEGVDFFTCGTYKWLLSGFGTALFYVRANLLDRIRSDRIGHMQVEKDLGNYDYRLYADARKFEAGTLAFGTIYQLGAALAYLERVGLDRIEAHGVGLADRLRRGLVEQKHRVLTPAGTRTSIVAFANPLPRDEAAAFIGDAGLTVGFRVGGTQIRVSPALFNTAADIDRLLGVTARLRS
jgi:selenocysteine lyase/cysteine desulfurase